MTDSPATLHHFDAPDGVRLAWHEMGEGRPLVLIHGLFSNAFTNWIRYGHAAKLAAAGFRVIMPDLRGHGQSGAPHDAASYPADILAKDGRALIGHLGLADGNFDLGGYSLGGRTSLRMMIGGVRPHRAVIGGMGLDGMLDCHSRAAFFRHLLTNIGSHPRGSAEWMAEAFLKTTGGDPQAMLPLLDSFVNSSREELAAISVETRIVCGVDDSDNGSAQALADALKHARYVEIPGNHMSAVVAPELGDALVNFLTA